MPAATDGSKYLVGMRDDVSRWAEYKALRMASLRAGGEVYLQGLDVAFRVPPTNC